MPQARPRSCLAPSACCLRNASSWRRTSPFVSAAAPSIFLSPSLNVMASWSPRKNSWRAYGPAITVVEANLAVHISALRRALRDGQAGNRYLINIPGQGYRFVAPISITEEMPPASSWVPAIDQDFDMRAMLTRLIGSADEVRRLAAQLLEVSNEVSDLG